MQFIIIIIIIFFFCGVQAWQEIRKVVLLIVTDPLILWTVSDRFEMSGDNIQ